MRQHVLVALLLFWTVYQNICLGVRIHETLFVKSSLSMGLGQTFEGGISGRPQSEAHGAYAFCALACLCMLGSPREMIPKWVASGFRPRILFTNARCARYLDLPLLISWLSSRQHAPEGGFSGRTNKLVDGCYSHWVGGCWPLIDAAMNASQPSGSMTTSKIGNWYSQEGLTRYVLSCCQADDGGMRDKPNT